nr:GrpB family protein [Roseococcus pinisoli]
MRSGGITEAAKDCFLVIRIVEYRPDWPDEYRALAERLRAVTPPGAQLHHIGSTSVPQLAAKDVIDLQMTVGSLDEVDGAALAGIGFVERPGLSDHAPPGAPLPSGELAKRFFRGGPRAANLHVREQGRFNQRYALLCRDYLRAQPEAAEAYALIKRRLADRFPKDEDAYYDIKDPVFDILMASANLWARATGWRLPPGD